MRRVFVLGGLAGLALATIALAVVLWLWPRPGAAATPPASFIALATRNDRTEVRRFELDLQSGRVLSTSTIGPAIAHAEDAVVRGATIDADRVLVAVEEDVGPDRSFSGGLHLVDAGGARRLLGGLAYASTPRVTGHRAYLQVGRPGQPVPGRVRDDELSVVELDLDSGRTRTVFAMHGQLAYPVGVDPALGLIVYLIGPPGSPGEGGRLAAITLEGGALRDLGAIGSARDLSLTHDAVVYEGRAADGRRAVYSAPLDGGRRRLLLAGERRPLSPIVKPSGEVYSAATGASLEIARAADPRTGAIALQRHLAELPTPELVVRGRGELVLPRARGERLEPVGFVEAR